MNTQNIEEELLSEVEAAAILRVKPRTLTIWRCAGKGPNYVKIGRCVYYRRSVLRAYIVSCEVAA